MSEQTTIVSADEAGDASEGAAVGLLALMAGLSEEHWCAGWLIGLEYSLWRVRECEEHPVPSSVAAFGMGAVTDRQRDLLRLLSEEAGGWWMWTMDATGHRFVTLDEWRAHLREQAGRTGAA